MRALTVEELGYVSGGSGLGGPGTGVEIVVVWGFMSNAARDISSGAIGGNGGSATNTFYGYTDASPEELRGFTWDQPSLQGWWNSLSTTDKIGLMLAIPVAVGSALALAPALAAMGTTGAMAAILSGTALTGAQISATVGLLGAAFSFIGSTAAIGLFAR